MGVADRRGRRSGRGPERGPWGKMRCGRHSLVALAPALADGQGQQQTEQGPALGTVGRRDLSAATVGKARGAKAANTLLRQLMEKSGSIDPDMPLCMAYTGNSDENLKKFMADHGDLWAESGDNLNVSSVGCVIGAHVGPGAVAVAFFAKA